MQFSEVHFDVSNIVEEVKVEEFDDSPACKCLMKNFLIHGLLQFVKRAEISISRVSLHISELSSFFFLTLTSFILQ